MDPIASIGAQIRDDLEDLIEQGRAVWADRRVTIPEALSFLAEFHNRLEAVLTKAQADPEINKQILAAAFATAAVKWAEPIDFLPRMPEWMERKLIDKRIYKIVYETAEKLLDNFEPPRK